MFSDSTAPADASGLIRVASSSSPSGFGTPADLVGEHHRRHRPLRDAVARVSGRDVDVVRQRVAPDVRQPVGRRHDLSRPAVVGGRDLAPEAHAHVRLQALERRRRVVRLADLVVLAADQQVASTADRLRANVVIRLGHVPVQAVADARVAAEVDAHDVRPVGRQLRVQQEAVHDRDVGRDDHVARRDHAAIADDAARLALRRWRRPACPRRSARASPTNARSSPCR